MQPEGEASTDAPRKLFLSHSAEDHEVASYLADALRESIPSVNVFLASLPGHIPVGADWLASVKSALKSSESYVVLLTPSSVRSPWVWFEAGAAWMSERKRAFVTAGGVDASAMPAPLATFQILSLQKPTEAAEVFAHLGGALADPQSFSERLDVITREAGHRYLDVEGWRGVMVGDRYFAWEGPGLHALEDRSAVVEPPGLVSAIRGQGRIPGFGNKHRLTNHLANGRQQVFETDRKGWKREVMNSADTAQVLLVHLDATR